MRPSSDEWRTQACCRLCVHNSLKLCIRFTESEESKAHRKTFVLRCSSWQCVHPISFLLMGQQPAGPKQMCSCTEKHTLSSQWLPKSGTPDIWTLLLQNISLKSTNKQQPKNPTCKTPPKTPPKHPRKAHEKPCKGTCYIWNSCKKSQVGGPQRFSMM